MDIRDLAQVPLSVELAGNKKPTGPESSEKSSFGNVLQESLSEVNRLQQEADQAITALATGDNVSVHDTMIAMEQADVSFRLMMEVRNKIVEAYQEILRTQV